MAPFTQEKERHERRNKEREEMKGHNNGRHDNELWSLPMLLMGEKRKIKRNKKHRQEGK